MIEQDEDDYGETYERELPYPFVGELRFFLEDGKPVQYEFTEEGAWIQV